MSPYSSRGCWRAGGRRCGRARGRASGCGCGRASMITGPPLANEVPSRPRPLASSAPQSSGTTTTRWLGDVAGEVDARVGLRCRRSVAMAAKSAPPPPRPQPLAAEPALEATAATPGRRRPRRDLAAGLPHPVGLRGVHRRQDLRVGQARSGRSWSPWRRTSCGWRGRATARGSATRASTTSSGVPDDGAHGAAWCARSDPVSVRPLPAPGTATDPAKCDSGSAVKPVGELDGAARTAAAASSGPARRPPPPARGPCR